LEVRNSALSQSGSATFVRQVSFQTKRGIVEHRWRFHPDIAVSVQGTIVMQAKKSRILRASIAWDRLVFVAKSANVGGYTIGARISGNTLEDARP
jgi:hypothetical protein